MVGYGVLRECLQDPDIQLVETVGRTATGGKHPKLREIIHADFFNLAISWQKPDVRAGMSFDRRFDKARTRRCHGSRKNAVEGFRGLAARGRHPKP